MAPCTEEDQLTITQKELPGIRVIDIIDHRFVILLKLYDATVDTYPAEKEVGEI